MNVLKQASAFFIPRSFLQSVPLGVPRLLFLLQNTNRHLDLSALLLCAWGYLSQNPLLMDCYTQALPALRIHCLAHSSLKRIFSHCQLQFSTPNKSLVVRPSFKTHKKWDGVSQDRRWTAALTVTIQYTINNLYRIHHMLLTNAHRLFI